MQVVLHVFPGFLTVLGKIEVVEDIQRPSKAELMPSFVCALAIIILTRSDWIVFKLNCDQINVSFKERQQTIERRHVKTF